MKRLSGKLLKCFNGINLNLLLNCECQFICASVHAYLCHCLVKAGIDYVLGQFRMRICLFFAFC